METYRYSLDDSSKKHICPNCDKKTFVFYIDTVSGEYLPNNFGRCDREQNCNYHNAPPKGKRAYLINFLSLNSISTKACKLVDVNGVISIVPKSQILERTDSNCWITEWYLKTSVINYLSIENKYFNTDEIGFINEVIHEVNRPLKKQSFHNLKLLNDMYLHAPQIDNLTEFLKSKFTKAEVFKAMQSYLISGTNYFWNNSTVFWQINNKELIQGAKVMLYDKLTGKRIKEPYNHINWLHKAIEEPNFNLCQCLFGLHRINEDYQKTIGIVESEKTAIIMSIFLPEYIWLATGSKGNFKRELLEPVKNRKIIAFPDKGEYYDWFNKAVELETLNFKIAVSDLIEQTEFEDGFDLADYYFSIY
jgi:hypothetical protein